MGDLLDDFIRANRERSLGAYGVHLYHDGRPPIERRVRSDDRVNLYSVAKTFTSVALGLAEAEGRLTLNDRLLDHFPELRAAATVTAHSEREVDLLDAIHELVMDRLA